MALPVHDSTFPLCPLVSDIVRTRFCVPDSLFLVEQASVAPLTSSGRWTVVRLLLGDGELCIQALLADTMHRFVHTGDIALGSYVRVQDAQVKQTGDLIYLVVHDLLAVGFNESVAALQTQTQSHGDETDSASEFDTDMDDVFEQLAAPAPAPKKDTAKTSLPVSLPQEWHDLNTPLKLTTLHAIPRLPYPQNWTCNVLAIVTELSDVQPSHLPPYRQRTARIADPSTAKNVHLTVFMDPEKFTPDVGSAVLLTGVKNHKFDGGSLKKYASDRPSVGVTASKGWWFQDPWDLTWCDVTGIKAWWEDMKTFLHDDEFP